MTATFAPKTVGIFISSTSHVFVKDMSLVAGKLIAFGTSP